MSKQVTINSHAMPALNYQGQRVVTFAMVDKVHGRKKGTAKRTFQAHRDRFTEGDDYFLLTRYVIRSEFPDGTFEPNAPDGIVITESGYLTLVKTFTDDLAWQVQKELVKAYFRTSAFPELQHVHVPSIEEYAAMSPEQAMNHFAEVSNTSKVQHGQQGSAGMTLRRRELKVLRPIEKSLKDMFQFSIGDVGSFPGSQEVNHGA